MLSADDELESLTVWGKKLLCGLVVQQQSNWLIIM